MIESGVVSLRQWRLGGNHPIFLVSGPCVIESVEHCFKMAEALSKITSDLGIPFIFKASYDKANRTSIHSYRGPGLEKGLQILQKVRQDLGVAVLSDVHAVEEVGPASEVLDVLQIPAFLSRQTDLIVAAAASGKPVNIKKGPFLAPLDIRNILEKAQSAGSCGLFITERGVSFGYNNLVVDFKALPMMRAFGVPVIFDATHSVQLPGGAGNRSGGSAEFIPSLARAAAAVGVDGLFLEVHESPQEALSDGANALELDLVEPVLREVQEIDRLVKMSFARLEKRANEQTSKRANEK